MIVEEHAHHSCIDMARPMLPPMHVSHTACSPGWQWDTPCALLMSQVQGETAWATTSPKWGTNALLMNRHVRKKIILPSSHTSQECNVLLTPPSSLVMSVLQSPLTSHSQACHQIPQFMFFLLLLFFSGCCGACEEGNTSSQNTPFLLFKMTKITLHNAHPGCPLRLDNQQAGHAGRQAGRQALAVPPFSVSLSLSLSLSALTHSRLFCLPGQTQSPNTQNPRWSTGD